MTAPTEVFEVVERRSGTRAMEHLHLTAMAALDWLEGAVPPDSHSRYRVQSVAVYAPRPKRYDQCDDTCTVDCGHCKGAGRPAPYGEGV